MISIYRLKLVLGSGVLYSNNLCRSHSSFLRVPMSLGYNLVLNAKLLKVTSYYFVVYRGDSDF